MGRSRVYCTHPTNANRQHNTKTARPIPLPELAFHAKQEIARLNDASALSGYPMARSGRPQAPWAGWV